MQKLFQADESELFVIRDFFHQFGARIEAIQRFDNQNEEYARLKTYEMAVKKSRVMRALECWSWKASGGL